MSRQKEILVINTGGTFNKNYDPIKGELTVDDNSTALEDLASKWLCHFEIINIIGKDSRDFTSHDRLELLATISQTEYSNIIVIHGTDTIAFTAEYLEDADLEKCVILTGAMVPYSIDPVEASANFASAYGYMQLMEEEGIYIVMNGVFASHEKVRKDRKNGKFVCQ
jgi:L-asparaginase